MRITKIGRICFSAMLAMSLLNSAWCQDTPQYSIEVRYLSTTEPIVRSLGLSTFATSPPESQEMDSTFVDQPMLEVATGAIRLNQSKTMVESQLPISMEVLTKTQARSLLEAMFAAKNSSQTRAPKVIVNANQTAQISDQVQRPFVTGFEPGSGVDNVLTLQPMVHVIAEGTNGLLRVRPIDNTNRQIDLRMVQTSIKQVREVSTGDGSSLVQIPEVAKNVLELSARLQSEQYLFVWWPHFEEPKEETSVVARASAILANKKPAENIVLGLLVNVEEVQD